MGWWTVERRVAGDEQLRRRLAACPIERVCVVKLSALGDVVQTLPLLPVLRARFPEARIAWVVKRQLAELLTGHPCLDELITLDAGGSPAAWLRLAADLRRRRFDVVLDLQGLLRSGLMTLATAAPCRIGLETAREASHLACHMLLSGTARNVAAHRRYWRVAEALGLGHLAPQTQVAVPEAVGQQVRNWLEPLGGRLLAVHAGAQWITKRWPAEKFAEVALRAASGYGLSVVLVGGPDDRQSSQPLRERLAGLGSSRLLDLVGRTSLKELASLLANVDLLLTTDSGPMHLAAGLGTPVVGVFTCTSPQRSGPPGAEHELVTTGVACRASYRKQCPHSGDEHLACWRELDAERVWQALGRLIARSGWQRRAG